MLRNLLYSLIAGLSLATFTITNNEAQAAPASSASVQERAGSNELVTSGRPENRWRYRRVDGRWWYWMPERKWSYFDGNRWVVYRGAGSFNTSRVDPALLRPQTPESILGAQRWAQANRPASGATTPGAGWTMSGTRGPMGGASSLAPQTTGSGILAGGVSQPAPATGDMPRGR